MELVRFKEAADREERGAGQAWRNKQAHVEGIVARPAARGLAMLSRDRAV